MAIGILILGIKGKIERWRLGRTENIPFSLKKQIPLLIKSMASQNLLKEQKITGVMHLMVFYGFVVLAFGTAILMIEEHFGLRFLKGSVFVFYKITLNTFGLAALIGLSGLLLRRYLLKKAAGANGIDSFLTLFLPILILITGFIVQGSRIAASPVENSGWEWWAYPSYPIVALFENTSISLTVHKMSWWAHMLLAFTMISGFLWLKLSHIFVAPLNIFYESGRHLRGQPRSIDLGEKNFGVSKKSEFTYHQLMSLDACISAGRCEIVCPPCNTGKPLSPREINEKINGLHDFDHPIVEEVIGDEIWFCTTCGSCQQKCPVMADSMDKIIDLRRYRVMNEGKMPDSFNMPMVSTQKRGHPWSGVNVTRTQWAEGMNIPLASETKNFDVLFWVGCTGALVERNMEVTRALAELLQQAGVDFAILGQEESCTGHMQRRAGNEYLYQMMAKKNIKKINQYQFDRIMTACPHCYNTLKIEYRELGAQYHVISHVEFISELIKNNKLTLQKDELERHLTYHDPCYLGRLNGIFDAPRALLKKISGSYSEMQFSGCDSFCCGGGGGGIWMEDTIGSRINEMRISHALRTGAEAIAVACPFCLQMLESGLTATDDGVLKIYDIAELVLEKTSKTP
jgi:Fe-S oxidoreductase/nitrate reductase gamma subunit